MAIKKIQNLEFKKNLTMLIYGQKGIGKTTLALSASPNTLLIDADNGANRVNTEHLMTTGVIQVQNYNEIMADLDTDLAVYDTIIIDTLGKLVDYIIDSLRAQNAKWGSPQGGLSMQGWGVFNMTFKFFCNKLKSMCKNLIFIAHEIVEKRGDVIRLIPDVRMNNYAWLATELDLIGYVEYKGQDRIISFSPSEEHDGKNTGGFDNQIKIPLLQAGAPNNFLATAIISKHFDNVEDKEKLQKAVAERFSDIDNIINSINDADDANICINEIKQLEHIGTSLQYAQTQFKHKVRALGLQYDKDTKSYTQGGGTC